MTGRLPADCLALATGIFPTRHPSESEFTRATKLHNKAQAHLRAFFKAERPEPWEAWQRPPEQSELHKDLVTELDSALAVLDGPMPAGVLPQWWLAIGAARKYLADKWPIFEAEGLTPANFALSSDEYGDIWDLVRAVDSIENFFADLRSHCLCTEQVDAVKACWPDWYETLDQMVFEELADIAGKKKQLTWQQEDMVRVLRGLPNEEPITATQPSAPPKRKAKPQQDRAINQARTPNERIDATAAR
jgi:hypothetical protein